MEETNMRMAILFLMLSLLASVAAQSITFTIDPEAELEENRANVGYPTELHFVVTDPETGKRLEGAQVSVTIATGETTLLELPFFSESGEVTFEYGFPAAGTYDLTVTVTPPEGASFQETFALEVTAAEDRSNSRRPIIVVIALVVGLILGTLLRKAQR